MRLRNVLEIMWPKLGEQEKARVKALLNQAKGEGALEPKKLFAQMAEIVGKDLVKEAAATLEARNKRAAAAAVAGAQQQPASTSEKERNKEIVTHAIHCKDDKCSNLNCAATKLKLKKMSAHNKQCANTPENANCRICTVWRAMYQ